MVYFQTKNPNLGKIWSAFDWKMLINFMAIWNILRTFEIFYDYLVHFVFVWYSFPALVSCTKKNLATLDFHCVADVIKLLVELGTVGCNQSDQITL
jgi:hypothetical protein